MNMKNINRKKILLSLLAIVLIAIVIIKLMSNKEISEERIYRHDKEQPVNVKADTVKYDNVNIESSFSGTFEPNKETKISSEIQGKVNKMLVDLGSYVRIGEALIQLDNSLLKLQLQNIEVQIEGLEADVDRFIILASADAIQGVQLEKAKLGLKSANVQKATLLEQLNKSIIKAPFSGIVTAKLTEEGAFAAPGIPLLQITDISKLRFSVNVSENDLSKFQINNSCEITVDSYPELILSSRINMIGSKANMGNSFPIHFIVINTSDSKIKSGMFGKVNQINEMKEKGITISASVVVGSSKQPQVFLVKNGKATLQYITIARRVKNKVVVSSGLSDGDIIVTDGFINLYDGANVLVEKN
jgi:RND family efflux transporter MFP subunit